MSVAPLTRPRWPYGRGVTGNLLSEGTHLGAFELRALLGFTIFGGLYRARHLQNGAGATLLVFADGLAKQAGFLKRVQELAKTQREIQHEHLLAVEGFHEADGHAFLVYADLEAITLTAFMNERRGQEALSPAEARFILSGIAQALEAMRAHGYGHQLLAPEFIYLSLEGRVKVFGFGLFEALDRKHFDSFVSSNLLPLAEDESPCLTVVDILSPEVRDSEAFDVRSDLYALGIIGYYLLTGTRPVADWILPSVLRPELGDGWDLFVSHCLEPNPDHRYPTVAAYLADLDIAETLKPQAARPQGGFLRKLERIPLPEPLKRRMSAQAQLRLRLAMLAVAGAVLIGGASWWVQYLVTLGSDAPMSIRKVPTASAADVVLRVEPVRARVRFTEAEGDGYVVIDGALFLRMDEGSYQAVVEAPRYRTRIISFDLGSERHEQTVVLEPAWAPVDIKSVPGAHIHVQAARGPETFLAEVDATGQLSLPQRLFAGEYSFRASLPDHEPWLSGPLTLSDRTPTVLEALPQAEPARLTITGPLGVELYLNDVHYATTPVSLENIPALVPLTLELRRPGYRTFSETVELRPAQEHVFRYKALVPETGELDLQLTLWKQAVPEPSAIAIRIGEETFAYVPGQPLALPTGEHILHVSHPDYVPAEIPLTVTDGGRQTLELDLAPRPARLQLALPAGLPYRLLVNGQPAAAPDNITSFPPGQVHEIRVEPRDFLIVRRTLELPPNALEVWEVPLKPLPAPSPGEAYTVPYLDLELAWIPPGQARMGSPRQEQLRLPTEEPATTVRLEQGFWMTRLEMTQDLYERLMGRNPSSFEGPRRPVESLTWAEAAAFCARLTEVEQQAQRLPEGYVYRLPTEAEWEYAARAGTTDAFAFGDEVTPAQGNFRGRYPKDFSSGAKAIEEGEHYGTVDAGTYPPNAWGLYDMHGNVAEWVLDTWHDRLAGGTVGGEPRMGEGSKRTIRGGAWSDFAHRARAASRDGVPVTSVRNHLGFRVVLAPAYP